MPEIVDVAVYAGPINRRGYEEISRLLRTNRTSDRCVIVLATPGGDPHAGFRIARALQHAYGGFEALIPKYCKSAGTLIVAGAKKLYMDDMSELGPLDIQIKKGDEVLGRSSGLDIFQAVNFLKSLTLETYREYLMDLTGRVQVSTRLASDMATRLTCGLVEPIASQIDPIKLAEMQRATDIALEYGSRLAETGGNLTNYGLERLVTAYPSHSFVIDRKEARSLFLSVESPPLNLMKLGRRLSTLVSEHVDSQVPVVELQTLDLEALSSTETESENVNDLPDVTDGERRVAPGVTEVDGSSQETSHSEKSNASQSS